MAGPLVAIAWGPAGTRSDRGALDTRRRSTWPSRRPARAARRRARAARRAARRPARARHVLGTDLDGHRLGAARAGEVLERSARHPLLRLLRQVRRSARPEQ